MVDRTRPVPDGVGSGRVKGGLEGPAGPWGRQGYGHGYSLKQGGPDGLGGSVECA